jgi:hypothetical protein
MNKDNSMSKQTSTALILKKMKSLFEPPVLSSENLKEYNTILEHAVECIKPRDLIEQILVVDYVDSTWNIKRYKRNKNLLIEREHQRQQKKQQERRQQEQKKKAADAEWDAKRAKAAEQASKAKQSEPVGQAGAGAEQAGPAEPVATVEQVGESTTQSERMRELEAVIDGTISDVDDIIDGPADEVDHAAALEAGVDHYAQLDRFISVETARRDDTLEQIELYRQGLGQHLRRVSDEIIEGEFSETKQDAPTITGPGDGER